MKNFIAYFFSFVTEISEHIKIKAGTEEEDGTNFDAFFPHFIWAIRDFTLQLELDGKPITSDEYLEHALTPKRGIQLSFPLKKNRLIKESEFPYHSSEGKINRKERYGLLDNMGPNTFFHCLRTTIINY